MTLSATILAALTVCSAHVNGDQLFASWMGQPPAVQPKILQDLRYVSFEEGYEDCNTIIKVLLPKAIAEADAREKAAEAADEAKRLAQARKDHPVLAAALKALGK